MFVHHDWIGVRQMSALADAACRMVDDGGWLLSGHDLKIDNTAGSVCSDVPDASKAVVYGSW